MAVGEPAPPGPREREQPGPLPAASAPRRDGGGCSPGGERRRTSGSARAARRAVPLPRREDLALGRAGAGRRRSAPARVVPRVGRGRALRRRPRAWSQRRLLFEIPGGLAGDEAPSLREATAARSASPWSAVLVRARLGARTWPRRASCSRRSRLWMVLSRADLPSVLAFPPELWANVTPERAPALPHGAAAGRRARALRRCCTARCCARCWASAPRAACLVSGLLLYHFAPFETIIRTPNPYLRGLTIPTLGLLVLSFSRCGDALALAPRPPATPRRRRPDYRWPLRLVQVLFCQIYLFAG